MTAVGSVPSISLEYSTDGGTTWSDFIVDSTTITLANIGDKVFLRAKTTNARTASDWYNANEFRFTGDLAVSGSPYSLLNKDWLTAQWSLSDWALCNLFKESGGAFDIEGMSPLDKDCVYECYNGMFGGSGIYGRVPKNLLPSMNLAHECYGGMFGNTNITSAPDLPATTPATGCYYGTFYGT